MCCAYVLNTRNEGKNTVFYSYVACFVNTLTLNMYGSMSFTGFTRRNTLFMFVWLRLMHTWLPIQHVGWCVVFGCMCARACVFAPTIYIYILRVHVWLRACDCVTVAVCVAMCVRALDLSPLSMHRPIYLFTYLSMYLYIYLSIYLDPDLYK